MALWSVSPAGTRETAFASARSDVRGVVSGLNCGEDASRFASWIGSVALRRSEEHTSELQSHLNLVCRLLLEKKKKPHNRDSVMCMRYTGATEVTRVVRVQIPPQ